jgi:acyl transferase domain-containing protein/acyl-CoA synthetase (AMP-forming)/AMP-acid ligase II/NADPH:quinone reductase-like Zn-dependent oxidoreductase/short-subunit dehydrogenase/acyl carrier protein
LAIFSTGLGESFGNLNELLRARAAEHGPRVLFRYLPDGETEESRLTYAELDLKARSIAAALAAQAPAGERALLYYPAGPDFVAAFWGCLSAGVVAVPVFPARLHRQLPRLLAIAGDSDAKLVLTTAKLKRQAEDVFKRAPALKNLQWIATDDLPAGAPGAPVGFVANPDTLAFLQYTSGSTAAPRGVMVTHGNLLHNLACLRDVFQFSAESIGVTWLPHFHDMGLIGGLLQPIYAGGEMIVMPPSSFLQNPIRWLAAISRYRATTMVAPNFAYELCAQKISKDERAALDLSSVNVALCGAEPVRPATLAAFAEAFGPHGFREEAFRPAYGLAESTLIVSGRSGSGAPFVEAVDGGELQQNRVRSADRGAAGTRELVGCGGIAPGMRGIIVDSETSAPCAPDRIGEIWVCGPSVAAGYWRKPEDTREIFGAYLLSGEGPFLRTGDLGFFDRGKLFITGRRKDLIIIRGSNHYPQDLEYTVERSHRALRPASGAAFSIEAGGAERLIVVQEVNDRESVPGEDAAAAIRRALIESHEVYPDTIVLIAARSIPRTSSGKIQRYACREAFLGGALDVVHEWRDPESRADAKQSEPSHPRSGLVWDYLSTQSYSHRLAGHAPGGNGNGNRERAVEMARDTARTEPIAIVGMGCRFPGASGLDEFWSLVRNGVDAITEIPSERWNIDTLYDPLPGTLAKMSTRWGGFLTGVDRFDPHFFGISPREAASMDPQQRVLLEVVWEALENAGQPPDKLAGTRTGVFVGIGGFDYTNVLLNYSDHFKIINAYLGTGNAHSIAANRISYLLDLRGPSLAIDTACSSSLVAIHMACESLRVSESNLAIAAGVNLILSPEVTIAFSHARMMAADGRCKTFDAKADGYVRAEGAGAVILKRLSDALRDRDHIFALIRGSAVNQDGRTAGIAAPNASAQQAVIREALARAAVSPSEITYLEAHGTGTSIGDPIEVEAVKAVLGETTPGAAPLVMGSVKANIGHAENASGMASLAKVVNCLQHHEIPGQLHFKKLNPRISLAGTRIAVAAAPQPWPRAARRRIAGVSSFGFGGTNAHIVVEEPPVVPRSEGLPRRPSQIFTLSARSESAIKNLAARFEKHLADHPAAELADICFSANAGRSHFARRLAVVAETKEQLREALANVAAGTPPSGSAAEIFSAHSAKKDGPRVAFLFGAETGLDARAACELHATQPVFRAAIDRCARALDPSGGGSPFASVSAADASAERRDAALFALEFAFAELWRSWGIQPDAVLGAGVGEYVAAAVSGAVSCEDALRLVVERARILQRGEQNGDLDRLLDEFERTAATMKFESPRVPFVSSLAGQLLSPGEVPGAAYWRSQIARTAPFKEGIETLATRGYEYFLEVGPAGSVTECPDSQAGGSKATLLHSLDADRSTWRSLLASLASLYVHGAAVDWNSFDEPYEPRKLPLPTYPFERERCWEDPYTEPGAKKSAKPVHPLLGERVSSALPMPQFQSKVGIEILRYLNDHRVQGSAVFPAAAYLEMARAAAAELLGAGSTVLSSVTFQEALLLPASGVRSLQLVSSPASGGGASFQIYSSSANLNGSHESAGWTLHASGDMRVEATGAAQCAEEQFSLDEIRSRCPRAIAPQELYGSLKAAGFEYGPSFQGVRTLYCGDREALGEVTLPAAAPASNGASETDGTWMHPALLDSCLQVLAGALPGDPLEPAKQKSAKKLTYLPVGVSSIRFPAQPGSRIYSHSVLRPGSSAGTEFLEADIRLLDKEGSLIGEILGFRVKLLSGEADREARDNPGDLLYEVSWTAKNLPSAKNSGPAQPASWFIVADRGGAGRSLAAQLESHGETCSIAGTADFQNIAAHAGNANVVYLASLDQSDLGAGEKGGRDAENHCLKLMQLVQSLIRDAKGATRRLWIVTRGAQAAGNTARRVSLAQTPLWGMAKSLDLEHPELGCTRIDLDPEHGPEEISMLVDELSHPGTEREVAFRNGSRYAARLIPRAQKLFSNLLMEFPDAESFHLGISSPGALDNLMLRGASRAQPRPGEVEIRVNAAGLNFRDVMNAAGVYPGGPIPFGAECAGTITAVGEGVQDLRVGDEVIALASGSFGAFVMADARAVIPKPAALSFGQAATIPIAFLTAYYSLHQLAKLAKGERVLIHAAAGGVGLAAVQLAQQAGAEIFATAGSPEKRAHLKSMRVPHIFDSRSLAFADEILKKTGGCGVDVVLNSLPGEYITRSLSILAAYGRFVEIGKTDIYQNKPMGLFPFRNNLSYFALDLERVCREKPELVRSLLFELMAMFEKGALKPLPHNIFRIEDAANAFRYMARRKNIGKIVLSFRGADAETRSDRRLAPRPDATYLITGGHGGLGLAVGRWLVEKGAKNIALLSRGGASAASDAIVSELAAEGATVKTIQADISKEVDVTRALAEIRDGMPPLRGVVHAAGVLDDHLFVNLTAENLQKVLAPKAVGAWNLHTQTAGMPLDFFVLFSSVASVLGSPGQANYAAANAFLDGLAHDRRSRGLPCLSINWGPWAEIGMATRAASARGSASRVMNPLAPEQALAALDRLIEKGGSPQAVAMSIDWALLARSLNGNAPPPMIADLLKEKAKPAGTKSSRESGPRFSVQELFDAPAARRHALLLDYVQRSVAAVMSLEAPELDPEESLSNLGLDSLMGLELQHSLEESLGAKLPIELLMGMPTLNEFVTRLLDILEKNAPEPDAANPKEFLQIEQPDSEPRESAPPST